MHAPSCFVRNDLVPAKRFSLVFFFPDENIVDEDAGVM